MKRGGEENDEEKEKEREKKKGGKHHTAEGEEEEEEKKEKKKGSHRILGMRKRSSTGSATAHNRLPAASARTSIESESKNVSTSQLQTDRPNDREGEKEKEKAASGEESGNFCQICGVDDCPSFVSQPGSTDCVVCGCCASMHGVTPPEKEKKDGMEGADEKREEKRVIVRFLLPDGETKALYVTDRDTAADVCKRLSEKVIGPSPCNFYLEYLNPKQKKAKAKVVPDSGLVLSLLSKVREREERERGRRGMGERGGWERMVG